MLEGKPFKAILAQACLGTSQPVKVRQVVGILMRFPCLGRMGFPGSHRGRGLAGGSQAMQIQNGLVPGLLPENGSFQSVLGFSTLVLRRLLLDLEEGRSRAGFAFSKVSGRPGVPPLSQLAGKVPHILQSHVVTVEIEAQRQVSVEAPAAAS